MKNYKEACEIIRASLTAGETQTTAYTRAGLAETTYFRWKQEKPDFAALIKDAEKTHRESKVYEAKVALHRAACGYETTEVRTEYGVGANGQPIIIRQIKTTKFIPPNVQACKEELHNFAPGEFGNTAVDDTVTGIRVEVVTGADKPQQHPAAEAKNFINESDSVLRRNENGSLTK